MKKSMRKLAMFFVTFLLVGTLGACSKFDASGYMKAVLDNIYFNDSTAIVELGYGTAEEAAVVYDKGIDSLMDITLSAVNISEELKAEYREFYKELYANAKYTVGEAVEVDETTFEVTVTCEKLNVFADAFVVYETKQAELVAAWTETALAGGEVPTDEEKYEQFFIVYKDCLIAELADVSYDAPTTVTVRVESTDGVWEANQEDISSLGNTLFDFEYLFETE